MGSAGNAANSQMPTGMPTTAPAASSPTDGQSAWRQILRRSCRPTRPAITSTAGTTSRGSRNNVRAGTTSKPKPKPVKPRRNPAAKITKAA
jgi:hypothetical protein